MKHPFKNSFMIILILLSLIASGMKVTPAYADDTMEPVPLSLPAGWSYGYFYGVWGSSLSDVYAVGYGYNGSALLPLLYRRNGSSWTASNLSLPSGWSSGHLYGVWGSGANDVYAVGSGYSGSALLPLLYRWNGSSWTASSPALPGGWSFGVLTSVWGSGPSNVYAAGYGYNGSADMPLLYRWNGSSWTASNLSLPSGWSSGSLYGVWGSGANDVYAVGSGHNGSATVPLLYRWNGSSWTAATLSLPAGVSSGNFKGVWGSGPSDVYAVGSGYNGSVNVPLLYHWNGSGWTASTLSLPAGGSSGSLYGVWGSGANDVYAVGSGNNGTVPLLYHKNGSGWTASSLSLPAGWGRGFLNGGWGSGASDVYAVGSGYNGSADMPLVYHSGTSIMPPGQAMLVAPNGSIATNKPVYTWEKASGATWYYLWVNGPSGNVIKQWFDAALVCGESTCSATPATTLSAGAHTFWVQTWNPGGYGLWSDGMSFNFIPPPPPGQATLVSPNGSIYTNKPTYTWDKVADATWYYLWVNGPSGNVIKQWFDAALVCGESTCSATPVKALGAGAHTFWVQTWNPGGYGSWSDGMSFSPSLPGAATLTSPSGSIVTKTPTYTWDKVAGATWYYLWVNGPSGTVIKQWFDAALVCGESTCSATPATTLSAGSHTFWVQTWNNVGYGPWSGGLSFSPSLPGAATLTSPSGSVATNMPTYTWNKVTGATWYYLWVNGPSGTVVQQWYEAAVICGESTCSATPDTTLSAGTHSWWVQTWNNVGYGPWSSKKDFTVSP